MRILLIEDNVTLAQLLASRLDSRGFGVDCTHSLSGAKDRLTVQDYDALILDLGLPDGDGIDWLNRQSPARPPVLILSARGQLKDRVLGLDAGADDYLVKPADAEEIAARLRALLRRPGFRGETLLSCGPIRFNTNNREITINGKVLVMGRRESDFLEIMMRRCGNVVTRASLEAALYGLDDAVTPNALEATASRLRKSLAAHGLSNVLHTVRGVGYYMKQGQAL